MVAILILLLLWRIWKFMKRYAEFPTYPIMRHIVYCTVMNKIPKHLPFASFFFQEAVRIGKMFQDEDCGLVWLPEPSFVILGGDAVQVFSNDPDVLRKSTKYNFLREIFGTGLLTSNGDIWKTNRKLLNPVFHVGMLKNKLPIFNEGAKVLVKKLEESMDEICVDFLDHLKPCLLGNFCEYALDLKMNTPENKEIMKKFMVQLGYVNEFTITRIPYPWLHFKFMMQFTSSGRKYIKTLKDLHNLTREMISAMSKKITSQQADSTIEDDRTEEDETRKSFAHILLDHHMKDNSFTLEDVLSQVITFMGAGFDSMSSAILFSLFLLGHHSDVQDEAYNEVDSLSEESIKYEDLTKLKYLECVIKEALRLYPPVPFYGRTLGKDMKCGKYNVPKGTDILFFSYLVHRNPEVYPDPEKFDPNRFMESNSFTSTGNYVPFSEGIRYCIGKRFAMMEMKVILAYILRNFRITSLDRKEDVDLLWKVVLAPVKPLRFRFSPRQ